MIVAHQECGIQSKKRSRIRDGKFEESEKVLVLWFKETRISNIPVNVELLREKAVQLSKSFGMENFSASHVWFEIFKNNWQLESFLGKVQVPIKTFTFKREPCYSGEKIKERPFVLLCCNGDGKEEFPPVVIGR
ncbi:hypothetical protein AVEN_56264-1 [Araneus ventricosus]|uniref:HTH CENPB-type domain-containing protein n=1 Tax=Araneus ventricosus TaxID=182803 RepID=A0A4Y2FW97_ARAVE|nr:hypothetical protein AVEN_56264-1 [Araneus ventricosus]